MENKIISVPHSGTRSLKKVLVDRGLVFNEPKWVRKPMSERRVPESPSFHFFEDSDCIWAFKGVAHVPIRKPYDILRSWESRKKGHGRCGLWVLDSMREMIDWCSNRQNVRFYDTYRLPLVRGKFNGERLPDKDFRQTELWQAYINSADFEEIEAFYERIFRLERGTR